MYYSKFNYISIYEKDGSHLLINFLSRSADIVDEECAYAISQKKNNLPPVIAEYLKDRGYILPNETYESVVLDKLWLIHKQNYKLKCVINLDLFDRAAIHNPKHGQFYPFGSSVVLYNIEPVKHDFHQSSLKEFDINGATLMTTADNLTCFKGLLNEGRISTLFLIMQLNEVQTPLREDIESLLDQLVGKTMNVNIIIRISEKNVSTLYKLVNYFIGKGWPFHANFQCILEPEPSIGCIFGYWYPNPNILKAIFQEYIAHPQTEFCSLEKLIGVKEIHKIIWAGSPPIPNLTFCEAMNGLMVFTGDKMIHCPFETLEKQDEWNSGYNEYTSCKLAFTECPFNLSCGGGCRLISKDNRCPPVRDLLEISIEYYFDEFLKRMNFYDKYQGSP